MQFELTLIQVIWHRLGANDEICERDTEYCKESSHEECCDASCPYSFRENLMQRMIGGDEGLQSQTAMQQKAKVSQLVAASCAMASMVLGSARLGSARLCCSSLLCAH